MSYKDSRVIMRVALLLFLSLAWAARVPVRLLVVSKLQAEFARFGALSQALATERDAGVTLTVAHGDSWGSTSATSKLLRERPGIAALNALNIQVDTFGNNNFQPGLSAVQALLPALRGTIVLSNLEQPTLPRVARSAVLSTPNGARVGFVGVFSAADQVGQLCGVFVASRAQSCGAFCRRPSTRAFCAR